MFLFMALASFLIGLIPLERPLDRIFDGRPYLGTGAALCEAGKGAIAISLAIWLNGSQGAMSLSALAVMAGRCWSPFDTYRDLPFPRGIITAAVSASVVAPLSLLLIGGVFAVSRVVRRPSATAIWTALLIPVFLFRFYDADIYFVFGTLLAGLFINQYLGFIESTSSIPDDRPRTPSERAYVRAYRLRRLFRQMALVFLISLLLTGFYLTRYVYRGFGQHVEIFRRGPSTLPLVALTFDDGPNPRYTAEILDILKEYNVKATFFMIGANTEMYPEIARRVYEEGHEVGNHTHRHVRLLRTSYERSLEELTLSRAAIETATGARLTLMRPPQGLYGPGSLEAARDLRYTVVLWSLSSRDWTEIGPRDMARSVISRTRNGEVILFHDGGDLLSFDGGDRTNTVRALPHIIEGLKERGFTFVTVTEMMIAYGLAGEE